MKTLDTTSVVSHTDQKPTSNHFVYCMKSIAGVDIGVVLMVEAYIRVSVLLSR